MRYRCSALRVPTTSYDHGHIQYDTCVDASCVVRRAFGWVSAQVEGIENIYIYTHATAVRNTQLFRFEFRALQS